MDIVSTIRNNHIFRRFPITKEMTKFAFVGIANTMIDFSVYIFLTRLVFFFDQYQILANIFAFMVAMSFSFYANRSWTFRDRHRAVKEQYVKFFIVRSIGFVANQSMFVLLVYGLHFYDLLAKIAIAITVFFWSFFLSRYWVFSTLSSETDSENSSRLRNIE